MKILSQKAYLSFIKKSVPILNNLQNTSGVITSINKKLLFLIWYIVPTSTIKHLTNYDLSNSVNFISSHP